MTRIIKKMEKKICKLTREMEFGSEVNIKNDYWKRVTNCLAAFAISNADCITC